MEGAEAPKAFWGLLAGAWGFILLLHGAENPPEETEAGAPLKMLLHFRLMVVSIGGPRMEAGGGGGAVAQSVGDGTLPNNRVQVWILGSLGKGDPPAALGRAGSQLLMRGSDSRANHFSRRKWGHPGSAES